MGPCRMAYAILSRSTSRPADGLLAMMDAHYLTAARTGATTGVATRFMARTDARRVAVIGSGLEARTNLLGVCAVRDIERVTVFSPNPERRAAFAAAHEPGAQNRSQSQRQSRKLRGRCRHRGGRHQHHRQGRRNRFSRRVGARWDARRRNWLDDAEVARNRSHRVSRARRPNSNRLPDQADRRRIGRRHRRARPRHIRPRQSYRTAGSRCWTRTGPRRRSDESRCSSPSARRFRTWPPATPFIRRRAVSASVPKSLIFSN